MFRGLIDEGPTFGDSLAKVERWDTECLTAAVDVREAFWMESGADPQSRDACFSMAIDEVRSAVDTAGKRFARKNPMTATTTPNLARLDFSRTRAAIATYYRECAAGPDNYPDGGYAGANAKQWGRVCGGLACDMKETFFTDAAGAYSRDECLAMSVTLVQCLLPRAREP